MVCWGADSFGYFSYRRVKKSDKIAQGGVKLNGEKLTEDKVLSIEKECVLQAGKRKFKKINVNPISETIEFSIDNNKVKCRISIEALMDIVGSSNPSEAEARKIFSENEKTIVKKAEEKYKQGQLEKDSSILLVSKDFTDKV